LLRLILFRAALIALPILAWSLWAQIARRRGKTPGRTPWAWLIAAGLGLSAAMAVAVWGYGMPVSLAGNAAFFGALTGLLPGAVTTFPLVQPDAGPVASVTLTFAGS